MKFGGYKCVKVILLNQKFYEEDDCKKHCPYLCVEFKDKEIGYLNYQCNVNFLK